MNDCPDGFVSLTDIVPEAILEIRYYSSFNFVGERIDGYDLPIAVLTKETAKALKKVSDELLTKDCRLKIFDAYRPARAVAHFVRWAEKTDDLRMKPYFYPDVEKEDLFQIGYIAKKSGHSRGSTVDLTLFDMKKGREMNMGSPFDYFGKRSHADFTKHLSEPEIQNRLFLRETMLRHGFTTLEEEWWHFTLLDEPYPDTYFDFPLSAAVDRQKETKK